MASVKLNISLDVQTVALLKSRAAEEGQPVSRYIADLVAADQRRREDDLAAEGYQVLAADTGAFAEAALPLARETWPAPTASVEPADD